MKSIKLNNLTGNKDSKLLFESKFIWLASEAQSKPNPFEESIDNPPQGNEKPEESRKQEAKGQVTDVFKAKLDSAYESIKKQQESLVNAFAKMALSKELGTEEKTILKDYLKNLSDYEYKEINMKINDNPVKLTIAKSQDGKYIGVNMFVSEDSKGYEPNLIGKGKKEWVGFLKTNGEPITGNDKDVQNVKFPYKEVGFTGDSREKFDLTKPEGKLSNFIRELETRNVGFLQKERGNIKGLIDQLKPQNGQLTRLPGGYVISNLDVKDPEKPNIIVFKDGKAICYILKNQLQLAGNRKEFVQDRHAEIVAAQYTLDQAFREIRWSSKNKLIIDPKTFENIKTSLRNFARFVSDEYQRDLTNRAKPTLMFKLPSEAVVSYWRNLQDPSQGAFSVKLGNGIVLGFNTMEPDNVFLQNKSGGFEKKGVERSKLVLTDKEREQDKVEDKKLYEAAAKRAKEQNEKKAADEHYRKDIETTKKEIADEFAKEEKEEITSSLYHSKFKEYLRLTAEKDPYITEINFQGNDKNRRNVASRQAKLTITDMLKLNGFSQVIYVEIEGKKGKSKGMFYPGQKTVFQIDDKGNQINKPVKILDGDKLTLKVSMPKKEDEAKLLKNSKYEKLEQLENINLKKEKLKLLEKCRDYIIKNNISGGKKDFKLSAYDITLGLDKISEKIKKEYAKEYTTEEMTDANWETKMNTKFKDNIALQNTILQQENAVLKDRLIYFRAKDRVDAKKKQTTAPQAPAAGPATAPSKAPAAAPAQSTSPESNPDNLDAKQIQIFKERNDLAKQMMDKYGSTAIKQEITKADHDALKEAYKKAGISNEYYSESFILVQNRNPQKEQLPIYLKETEILKKIRSILENKKK